MTDINKQKFLAELGKLLTFMYEEDRQTALALYGRMFDKAEDEMALLQLLVSPTRQAVIVARAYNAREHKLQVYSQSRESASEVPGDEIPDYVRAITQIHQAAVSQRIIAPDVTAGQFSLFGDDDPGLTEAYAENSDGAQSFIPAVPPVPPAPVQTAPAAVPAPVENPVPAAAPLPAEEPVPAAEEAPAPEPEAAPAEEPAPAPAEEPAVPVAPPQTDVDSFIAGFAIADSELDQKAPAAEEAPAPEPEAAPAEEPAPAPAEEPAAPLLQLEDEEEKGTLPAGPVGTVRKPRTVLLILYILLAIPVTAAGLLVLLLPTALFLLLGVSVLATGGVIFMAAFSGFSMLADIMLVLGSALIVLAIGLLLFWIFIWFIGGAMVGLVRGVIALARRCCYKEVPAA